MGEVLIVSSKVKKFIKNKSGLNTSAKAIEKLSYAVEELCQQGIDSAKAENRKTVLDRDVSND